jgi:ribosomal protein S18 acetylase RimI-like enzyme
MKIIIKELNVVTEDLIKEIRALEETCKQHDDLEGNVFLDTTMNFNQDMKNTFLLYNDSKLISFLFVFAPNSNEGEISAYTLPEYRRKGYFKTLLERAENELKTYNVSDILFVNETKSKNGKAAVRKLKGEYEFTEYLLRYNNSFDKEINELSYKLQMIRPELDDLEEIIKANQAVFNDSVHDAKSMVMNTLESQNRTQYAFMLDSKIIGIGCVCEEENEVSIFGLGVLPEYQGRGFGREVLFLIIRKLLNQGRINIVLEVNSTNEKAYKLYRKSGFDIETSYDYYRKSIL